jgi:hypothetical protein
MGGTSLHQLIDRLRIYARKPFETDVMARDFPVFFPVAREVFKTNKGPEGALWWALAHN